MSATECPRCKEIELRLTDEEIDEVLDECIETYECEHCGHIECHVAGLPSWYTTSTRKEGVTPQKAEPISINMNRENDNE